MPLRCDTPCVATVPGFPLVRNALFSTAELVVKMTESVSVPWVVTELWAPEVLVSQIIFPQGITGLVAFGTISVTREYSEAAAQVSGLTAGKSYRATLVAKDSSFNIGYATGTSSHHCHHRQRSKLPRSHMAGQDARGARARRGQGRIGLGRVALRGTLRRRGGVTDVFFTVSGRRRSLQGAGREDGSQAGSLVPAGAPAGARQLLQTDTEVRCYLYETSAPENYVSSFHDQARCFRKGASRPTHPREQLHVASPSATTPPPALCSGVRCAR